MRYVINKKLNNLVFFGELCGIRNGDWTRERKKYWINISGGSLKAEEKNRIKYLATIFSSSDYEKIEIIFLSPQTFKIKSEIKKLLGIEKAKKIFDIINFFNARFERAWKTESQNLSQVKKYIQKNSEKILKAAEGIRVLTGARQAVKNFSNISLNLIASSHSKGDIIGWFSTDDKKTKLVLECSYLPDIKTKNFLLAVIAHELFHLALREKKDILKQIDYMAGKNKKLFNLFLTQENTPRIFEELIISSFTPEGIFLEKYFSEKIKYHPTMKKDVNGKISYISTRRFLANRLKIISSEYIKKNKKLDKKYFLNLIKEIKYGQRVKLAAH